MKGGKGKLAMSKGAIADALAAACDKKKSEMTKALDALVEVVHKEVKSTGKFKIPGVCMIKTRHKAATKAGKRMMFGAEVLFDLSGALLCHLVAPSCRLWYTGGTLRDH